MESFGIFDILADAPVTKNSRQITHHFAIKYFDFLLNIDRYTNSILILLNWCHQTVKFVNNSAKINFMDKPTDYLVLSC